MIESYPERDMGDRKVARFVGSFVLTPVKITNMAQLTPEEIAKIDEEELVRARARAKYAAKPAGKLANKPSRKSHRLRNFLIIIIGLVIFISIINSYNSKSSSSSSKKYPLSADVKTSNLIVEVTNNDSFDWTNCKLIMNFSGSYDTGSYYQATIGTIAPNTLRTYRLNDFIKNGTTERFNPYTEAMGNLEIDCQTPDGEGLWVSAAR